MTFKRLRPHLHLVLYLLGVILLVLPQLFPSLNSLYAQEEEGGRKAKRNRKDFIEAARDDQPLNLAKYSKESQEADFSVAGDLIINREATDIMEENNNGGYRYGGAAVAIAEGVGYVTVVPPATTGEYLADVIRNTNLAPQAYAQGLGFSSLTPILELWKTFRNVAYFLYIVIFIVIGFMIMFRTHVDHNTIITVQAALPKLIITLILITFSYAIAGFVVDLIYLLSMAALSLFQLNGIIDNVGTAANAFFGLSIFRIGIKYFIAPMEVAGSASNAISGIAQGIVGLPGGLFDWIVDALAYLIIAVAILIAMFRTFFGLITAYVGIILSVIFAPLILLFNAFPGSNTFMTWVKGMLANAAVFPAVIIMLVIGTYLVGGDAPKQLGIASIQGEGTNGVGFGEGSGFVPPLITSKGITWGEQQEEEMGVEHVRALIGLGFIMLLPEVVKIVKGFMKVEEDKFGAAALANAQRGWAPVNNVVGYPVRTAGTYARTAGGFVMNAYALQGAERAVGIARRIGIISKERQERVVRDMQNPHVATTSQAKEHADDRKTQAPTGTSSDS